MIRRTVFAAAVLFLLSIAWVEIGAWINMRELSHHFPEEVRDRSPRYIPAFIYYLRPLLGVSNNRYQIASTQLDWANSNDLNFVLSQSGLLVWRYYSENEVDSLIAESVLK